MRIRSLELNNYRNYQNQQIYFGDHINVLVGKNAQGKTNMLEGVFLCAIGRSPRTSKDKELIKWDASFSKITLELTKRTGDKKIEVYLFNNQNKAIKINSFPIKRMGELMGELNAVYFSPDEMKLVKESPDERRRFMDIDLSQFDKNYFYNLNKYNLILNQRNKLLKSSYNNPKVISDTISIWNEQLASVGCKIIKSRLGLIESLKKYASACQEYLTDSRESIELTYTGFVGESEDVLKQMLLDGYMSSFEKDLSLGYTTVGPHRDDIKILLNGIDVRHFGSQGQQRTVALALKLAELEVFNDNFGEYPVLLLDDVLSELDERRQLKLLNKIQNIQTIITCTAFPFDIKANKFEVENGKIKVL